MSNHYATPIVGIANMGNTCYMNAVLQSLIADRALLDKIGNQLQICDPGSMPLSEAFFAMAQSRQHNRVLSAQTFAAIMQRQYWTFETYVQQDAHEFLTLFIDLLHEEVSSARFRQRDEGRRKNKTGARETGNNATKSTGKWGKWFTNTFKCLMKQDKRKQSSPPSPRTLGFERPSQLVPPSLDYFASLQRVFVCTSCGGRSEPRRERQLGVSVSIPEDQTPPSDEKGRRTWNLRTLLWEYFEPELIMRKCDYCSGVFSVVESRMHRAPRCLVVQIKRVTQDGRKIEDRVKIPEYISVEPFIAGNSHSSYRYALSAVIRHSSAVSDSGHYEADIREDDGSWTCCDDRAIFPRYSDKQQDTQGYLCFYRLTMQ